MGNRICCLGGNPPQATASSDAGGSSPEGGNVRHVRVAPKPPQGSLDDRFVLLESPKKTRLYSGMLNFTGNYRLS
ncbi:hypothetical protein WN943_007061 [Citrus x changshan-huyou]